MLKILRERIGNLTIIEYLFFLVFVFGGVFVSKNFFKKMEYVMVDLVDINDEFSANIKPNVFWQTDDIKKDDPVYSGAGKEIAKVVRIDKSGWWPGNRVQTQMTIKIKSIYDPGQKVYLMDGNPIRVGEKLTLVFGKNKFEGLTRNVYQNEKERFSGYKKARAELTVRLRGYETENLNALKKMVVVDDEGKTILKVDEVKIFPAELYFKSVDGAENYLGRDGRKSDGEVKIELPEVWCKGDVCYYNFYQTFAIGDDLWAQNGEVQFGKNSVVIARKIYYEAN